MKTLFIWRIGGVGDLLWCTAALPVLRRQEFAIDFCTDQGGRAVLEGNPHVRRLIPWEDQRGPGGEGLADPDHPQRLRPEALARWFEGRQREYDAAVALTWSIEGNYLWRQRDHPAEYGMPQAERQTGINYTDEMVRRLAMPWLGGLLPELYPTAGERRWLRKLAERHRAAGEQFLLWHFAGSSYHKVIPQAPAYITGLLDQFPRLVIYLLADERLRPFLAPEVFPAEVRGRARSVAGEWSLRQQLLATSVADCVVGPESAIVNAAACFDTPKVIFYSHSAPHNLSLYWWNAYPILPTERCECAPCYRLIDGEPEDCRAYEADLASAPDPAFRVPHPAREGRGRAVGAKCCVHLDHGLVFRTIGGILQGRPDRTCPACGARKNRILEEGVYACACGARFGLPRPPQRPAVPPRAMICPICGADAYDRVDAPGAPGWARCACGVVFQDPRHLEPATYDEAYTTKYDTPEMRAKIRAVGERWIPVMEGALGVRRETSADSPHPSPLTPRALRLLEIGYCWPENLWLARERGWDVAGCEINKSAVADFPVIEADFEALDLDGNRGRFDAVISNHVFEHFLDPLKALEKMRELVRPGGLILIETPDTTNPHLAAHLHRKEHHVMWSPAALAGAALERGLEVVEVERHDGPDCGFISWYDFAILLRRPQQAAGGPPSAGG